MLHFGEGVIEMVEEFPPPLELVGAPETLHVVFKAIPLDEQQVAARSFDALLEPQAPEPGGRGDDGLGRRKGLFEGLLLRGLLDE